MNFFAQAKHLPYSKIVGCMVHGHIPGRQRLPSIVCHVLNSINTNPVLMLHPVCHRCLSLSLCSFQKFLHPVPSISRVVLSLVKKYVPRCIFTCSIHHSPKLSSAAISAAVTVSSRFKPHNMHGCRAGTPPSACFSVLTGMVSCKSGAGPRVPALI